MHSFVGKIGLTLATWRRARAAMKRQYDYEEVLAERDHKLHRLTRYAASQIKYYRELFADLKIHPDDIRTAEDLEGFYKEKRDQIKEFQEESRIRRGKERGIDMDGYFEKIEPRGEYLEPGA